MIHPGIENGEMNKTISMYIRQKQWLCIEGIAVGALGKQRNSSRMNNFNPHVPMTNVVKYL